MKTGSESTWDLPETQYELPCHKDHLFTLDGEYERNLKAVGEKFLITLILKGDVKEKAVRVVVNSGVGHATQHYLVGLSLPFFVFGDRDVGVGSERPAVRGQQRG
jgi:hypothetical protein